MFVADNDSVTIGSAAVFEEIEFILDTVASGAGIKPNFDFSTGVGTWSSSTPTDGTNGMRNTGIVSWDLSDISATWAVGTDSEYLIRITRTANSLTTTPIEDIVQISAATKYEWDKDGNIKVAGLYASTTLSVTSNANLFGQLNITNGIYASSTLSVTGNVALFGLLTQPLYASSTLSVTGITKFHSTSTGVISGGAGDAIVGAIPFYDEKCFTMASTTFNGTSNVEIGRYAGSNALCFDGTVGEVWIYKRALSAEEFSYMYGQTNGRYL